VLVPKLDHQRAVIENLRVSKEIKEALAEIAYQLQEQLKFYRELGISDIGGAGERRAPAADFRAAHEPAVNGESDSAAAARLQEGFAATGPQLAEKSQAQANQAAALPVSGESQSSFAASSLPPPEGSPAAAAKDEINMSKKKETPPQTGLFGEAVSQPDSASRNRLPVLSSLVQDSSLEAIGADIGDCQRCKLHAGRTKIVFGEGNPQARLMFVGEGPGANEDVSGRPFVGEAGKLLDKIIAAIGYKRQEVYIGNVVKCRPPGNRTPERDEVETCEQFLFRQIAVIKPKVIVALGSPAFQCLFRTKEPISKARGVLREWNGIKVMPTFHPAYLLRSPDKKREAWEDMKIVRDYLNSASD
jgi:uracil-DNA glycosylase